MALYYYYYFKYVYGMNESDSIECFLKIKWSFVTAVYVLIRRNNYHGECVKLRFVYYDV